MFRKILVGLDLAACAPSGMSPRHWLDQESVRFATRLAQNMAASLHFLSVLDWSQDGLLPIEPQDRSLIFQSAAKRADQTLYEIVAAAKKRQIAASWKFSVGKPWLEIVREVLRIQPDLLVIATREPTTFRRTSLGTTAMKLMNRCPCPVLAVNTNLQDNPTNILVATDLKPTSETGLQFGVKMAQMFKANAHLLHVLEYPFDCDGWIELPRQRAVCYQDRVREKTEEQLRKQLRQANFASLENRGKVHLIEGVSSPDVAIQQFIQGHHVDLLILGTGERGGAEPTSGSTAARLLPEVECSVLVAKSPGFFT